jgi:hypothetical protein
MEASSYDDQKLCELAAAAVVLAVAAYVAAPRKRRRGDAEILGASINNVAMAINKFGSKVGEEPAPINDLQQCLDKVTRLASDKTVREVLRIKKHISRSGSIYCMMFMQLSEEEAKVLMEDILEDASRH